MRVIEGKGGVVGEEGEGGRGKGGAWGYGKMYNMGKPKKGRLQWG